MITSKKIEVGTFKVKTYVSQAMIRDLKRFGNPKNELRKLTIDRILNLV